MNKFLVLGDVHFGKNSPINKTNATSFISKKLTDQIRLLDWVLDKCISNLIKDIVITGDIFEEPKPDSELINQFSLWLSHCKDEEITVHILLGNHDYLRIGSNISTPLDIFNRMDNVNIYKSIDTFYIQNTAITLIPFMDRRYLDCNTIDEAKGLLKYLIDTEISYIPKYKTKVCIGHLALEGSIYIGDEILDITNEILCPLDYFKDFDLTLMGHVHKFQEMSKNIFHIGSMDISNFGECDESKFIIIYDTEDNTYIKEEIPVIKLEKIKISISKENNNEEYLESLIVKANISSNKIYKLEIDYNDLESLGKVKINKILSKNNIENIFTISETKKHKKPENKKENKFTFDSDLITNIKKYSELNIPENIRGEFLTKAIELISEIK